MSQLDELGDAIVARTRSELELAEVAAALAELPARRLELMRELHDLGVTVTRIAEVAQLSRQQVSTTLNRDQQPTQTS